MKENNNFLYKGYLLVVEPHSGYWSAECKELGYDDTCTNISTFALRKEFKKFVDEKLEKKKEEKMTENSTKEMFMYKGYLLEIILDPTLNLYRGVCKELNITMVEEGVENLQDRFISYINSWRLADKSTEDKDKKIAKLIEVIDGLNKKLGEKDKKIERLKSKIAAVKFEIEKE